MNSTFHNPLLLNRSTGDSTPADLHDWLDTNCLIHCCLAAAQSLCWRTSTGSSTSTGSQSHKLRQMLTLLTYCYASGVYASVEIVRLAEQDAGVGYLSRALPMDCHRITLVRGQNVELLRHCLACVLERACILHTKMGFLRPSGPPAAASSLREQLALSASKTLFLAEATRRIRMAFEADSPPAYQERSSLWNHHTTQSRLFASEQLHH